MHSRSSTSPNSDADLVVVERPELLVAAHDGDGGGQRIGLAEDGVGDGDREIGDRVGVDDVAEVEDAGDLPSDSDQHVVVVGIVVHGGAAQARRIAAPSRDVDPIAPGACTSARMAGPRSTARSSRTSGRPRARSQ